MEFKPVPEPPERFETLETVRSAVPRVPQPEDDCCLRVQSRIEAVPDRDDASDWLTFLRALGLVDEYDRGYARTGDDPEREQLAERFLDRIVLAETVYEALGDQPATAEAVFERVRDSVPEWERRRTDDWEAVWRDRVRRLLDWAVLFALATRADGGYQRAST